MTEKIKLLTISDMPLVNSGVAIQTRHILHGLLKTGKYKIVSLGAAIRHPNYQPIRVEEFGDDWIVLPTNGYGDPNILRHFLMNEKPDAIWVMTDPRFYVWLFNMADEVSGRNVPLLYNHVWDNYPLPDFNKPYYQSCDFIGCISKLTYDIVSTFVGPEKCKYIPHAVNYNSFKQFSMEEIAKLREEKLKPHKNKFTLFYNSRNARRKMTSDIIKQYSMFLNIVGKDRAFFLLNTNPKDAEGGDLEALCRMLKLTPEQIMFTGGGGMPEEELVKIYNISDATLCLSNAEGFGLSSLESLACGTPVISTRTGGLQDQNLTEDGKQFGVSIKPAVKSLVGSQEIPYIYEDRVSDEQVIEALLTMYHKPTKDRYELGKEAREHVMANFDLQTMVDTWDFEIVKQIQKKKSENKKVKVEEI